MSYATVAELAAYLPQLRETLDGDDDELAEALTDELEDVLDRATAAVNLYLEVSADLVLGASATRVLYGDGGLYLYSDIPMSTVTEVETLDGHTVPDYVLLDGMLRITDSSGVLVQPWYPALGGPSWSYPSGWTRGIPYSVTATFGLSAEDMTHLTQATLERAVQIWRYRDSGGSETIGAEGAITTVRTNWTPGTKQGLDSIKRRLRGNAIGVY